MAEPAARTSRNRLPLWALIFGLFTAIGFLQMASVDWSRPLSIYDEVPHIDYTFRLADGQATTWDDVYSQRTLGIASCLEQQDQDPQCVVRELRDPTQRWPNGYSYEAQQTPLGYLPYAVIDSFAVDSQADHFSQIRTLRLTNAFIWVLLAALWALLVSQVTDRRVPALAATTAVSLNPMLVDRFTYVTNDAMAIVAATAVAVWLLYRLRRPASNLLVGWLLPALLLGTFVGMTKPTALIIVVPLAAAVWASRAFGSSGPVSGRWWMSVGLISFLGVVSSLAYQAYINALSQLDFETVISVILPRGSLDMGTASLLRITDISELVIGTGARTGIDAFEWGVRTPTVAILLFSLLTAGAFVLSFAVNNKAFPRLPEVDTRALGYSVLLGFIAMLVLHPALHFVRGEFLMPFTAGRFQATLIPLAGLATLPAFQRFRLWAWGMIIVGIVVAAFFS